MIVTQLPGHTRASMAEEAAGEEGAGPEVGGDSSSWSLCPWQLERDFLFNKRVLGASDVFLMTFVCLCFKNIRFSHFSLRRLNHRRQLK
jgi:hypothetical protein